jgi:endonuclease/exonuclease/phosphatase (EEP) superfamily protein YafD
MSIENWRQSVLSRVVRLTAKLLIGTFLLLTYAAVLALGICSIAGFFGNNHRYFELASHFRLVYFYGLLACCLALVLMRRWKGLAVSSAFLLLNVIPIAVLYFEGGPQAVAQGSNAAASKARELKVLQINVWAYKNKHYSDVIEVIRKHDPDVVGIVEVTRDWKKVLRKELKDYPHVAIE